MSGWLDGFGAVTRKAPAATPAKPATPKAPAQTPAQRRVAAGQTVELVEIPICPACSSRYLRVRKSVSATSELVVWECRECDHSWKGKRQDYIAGPHRLA